MIIKDLRGNRYDLTKQVLRELPKQNGSRYVLLRELQDHLDNESNNVPVRYYWGSKALSEDATSFAATKLYNLGPFYIGCRPFSITNYWKIANAAKRAK
jgi:hypothetical protein